jgi:hypothetical protein
MLPETTPHLNEVSHSYSVTSFEELAQNGVWRETVPDSPGGARRTLCAFEELAPVAQASSRRWQVGDLPHGVPDCLVRNIDLA